MVPKFRAWDKEENLWIKVASLVFDEEGEMWYLGPVMDDFNPVYYENELGKTWEIMQSTGLKDKNGVEIFEADVLKNTRNGKIRRVHWNPSCASFHLSKHGIEESKVEYWSLSNPQWSYEIIGNIYENPELLEQADEN
ncbi:YopX family protein [Enterococcus casseliflavus]|uniref:YopX family protein n=1 Tax=Enterococcus casseliflavus TaxID=37734 RepID=UPI002DBC5DB4|nr:YopX family protein [Enterococcus casseliflavus]MEB6146397.1 YopX family protein [Enterococcus casseliflavus]